MMANIMLINLAIIRFYDSVEEIKNTYNPPLGLLYLKSSLVMAGHKVVIIDLSKVDLSRKELFEKIMEFNPMMVGVSVYTENVDEAFKLCKGIKKKFRNIYTVLGGPQASLEPEYTINNDYVNFVLRFEGEASMLELVEALESKQQIIQYKDISGIVLKQADGSVYSNKKRKDIKDLDLLAFPMRKEAECSEYGSMLNLITSRGCPGNCIYCSASALSGARYRVRSISHTLLEMIYLLNLFHNQLESIYILDDTFTAIPERVFEFVQLKMKLKLDFMWRCESRVDVVTEEMIHKMADSNCIGVAFGVESGSQEILNKIHKNIDLLHTEYVVDLMYKYHIYTSLNFMLGHYCDTKETMNMTYEFIRKMYDKYGVGIFTTFNTPFPGTWQRVNLEKVGLKIILSSYKEYNVLTPSVEGDTFTVDSQLEVYKKILPIMNVNDFGLKRGGVNKDYEE